ncbi:MAG: DUF3617 family protein [Methyloprofundus sp.]|nr:DUF3617 family protein [Methyloprofundus sp.]
MNKKFIITLLLSSGLSTAYAQTPDIKEGLWEISSQASIVEMPMQMPALTQEQCFTKQSMSPENILQQNNCQINNMDIQPDRANWSMTCQQEGMTMQGSGNIKYQKTSFSGVFDLTMSGGSEGAMHMHTELKGRYIGKCP